MGEPQDKPAGSSEAIEAANSPETDAPKKKRRGTSGSFKPGRSGNPRGRPKLKGVELEVRELAKAEGPWCIKRLKELAQSENEDVAKRAIDSLLDRGLGKPRQELDIDANVNANIQGPSIFLPAEDPDPSAPPPKDG